MKKFTKFLLVILIFALAFAVVGCKKKNKPVDPDPTPVDETPKALKDAIDYVYALYKDKGSVTSNDWTIIAKATGLDIAWTVTVTKGQASDVVLTLNEAGTQYTVDVNEKSETEIAYILKATITVEGKTASKEFSFTVPAFKELTYAEYVAAEKNDPVVVKGVVTAVIGKANGNSYNCLFFQDADGGYYAYGMEADPSAEGENQVKPGMTVRVTGKKDVYSGTLEIKEGAYEILDKTIKAVTPVDYTAAYAAAKSLKDEALVGKQSILVTINNVTISPEDDTIASGYYKFAVGVLESYARLSSSVCPLNATQQATFKENHKAGYTATVTGVVCVYDGAFYLTPVDENAWSNLQLPKLSDAEAVAAEKALLTAPVAEVSENCEVELPTTGSAYADQVAITWASDNACAVVAEDSSKVVFTLPAEDTKVTLTATLKAGETTETVTFEVNVQAAPVVEYEAVKAATVEAGKAYKMGLFQANASVNKQLYFSGAMDGNFYATVERVDRAADVFFEAIPEDTKFYLYIMVDGAKKYITGTEYTNSKGYPACRLSLDDTASAAFVFDATLQTVTLTTANDTFYLGTYNTYTTISASAISYISGDKAANIGVTQFPVYFYTLEVKGGEEEPEKVQGAFSDDKYFGELELLGKAFIADVNAKGGTEWDSVEEIDTDHCDSGQLVSFYTAEGMEDKWIWLFKALSDLEGTDAHDPEASDFDLANHKPFFFANLCGFFTRTEHKDTHFGSVSMDFSDDDLVKAVLDKYLFSALAAKLAAEFVKDFNANTDADIADITELDTGNTETSYLADFYNNAEMKAKWSWLFAGLVALADDSSLDPSAEGFDWTDLDNKMFFMANISGLLSMDVHIDSGILTESMDFTDLSNVIAVLNEYIKANPSANDVEYPVNESLDKLFVTDKAADLEAGEYVTIGKARYVVGTNAFPTLEAALAAAEANATIELTAGNYAGATLATAGLTILGPNAGQNPVVGPRAEEATFTSDLVIGASNITLKGIALKGNARVFANDAEFENLTIENVFFNGISVNGGNTNGTAPIHLVAAADKIIKNVVIKNCKTVADPSVSSDRPMIMFFRDIEDLTVVGNSFNGRITGNANDGFKVDNSGAFGVKGNVTITDNTFTDYEQYVLWFRAYGAGTYTIKNNVFENCGGNTQTDYLRGQVTFIAYKGTAEETVKIDVLYNTTINSTILVRMDSTTNLADNATIKVNYNKILENSYLWMLKNENSATIIDASYNHWAAGAPDANKIKNATYENAYADAADVPAIGDADEAANTYTVKFDLNGGEWFEEDEITYVYGHEFEVANPEKTGFEFVAWADANGQLYTSFPASLHENLELTAVWKAN